MADLVGVEYSAASRLLEQHNRNSYNAFVQDAADDDVSAIHAQITLQQADNMSVKAADKQTESERSGLDTQSHELFPELGGPKPMPTAGVAPIWGAKNRVNGKSNGVSPVNGAARPPPTAASSTHPPSIGPGIHRVPAVNIPGRNVETLFLEPQHVLPRSQLKRPLSDTLKDINRRSRAQVSMSTMSNGRLKFEASGPQDIAQQALMDLVQQIGSRQTITVPIPRSARAHIIGKAGASIKMLQEQSGAKIQVPKMDEQNAPMDDDGVIDVMVEGNAHSAAKARDAILKIVGEKAAHVETRLRNIPLAFYPFIAGSGHSRVNKLEESHGVQIRVPPYDVFSAQRPQMPVAGTRLVSYPSSDDNPIQLAGERAAVQAVRAEIERQVEELRQQLVMEQLSIQRGRHQFIIGDRGVALDQFFRDTGCVILLPSDEEEDTVIIIGPPDRVTMGVETAMDLAMNMQCSNIDISRFHRQAPGGAAAHARNVTRYLRQRREIERIEREHNVHCNTPFSEDGALPWELYARDGKNAIRAQSDIKALVDSHPPSRISTITVDPFYHPYLGSEVSPRIRQEHGVQLVVPGLSEHGQPVLLVYEGSVSADGDAVPRSLPDPAHVPEMQRHLHEAQNQILDLINQQEAIRAASLDVPLKFHEKLKRFIKKEQANRDPHKIPVRVTSTGTMVKFRGPASSVEALTAKCNAFVLQEIKDEKERGFTMDFAFPRKFANHLIGKGGSHVRELREKFDVDIQVQDGKVELKGPRAKAEAAKTHIQALGRTLADEITHVVKIEPKFHRELIGSQGSLTSRLQTRYKVVIFFPRVAKPVQDDESVADVSSDAGKPRHQQAPDEVIIRGPKKGADAAREEMLSLLQYLKDHSFTATVTVQQKQLPALIGQGGSGMEQVRQSTDAKIDIPAKGDAAEGLVDIQIKGTKTQVAAAKKLLEDKKALLDDMTSQTIHVDRKYHRAIIGTGGATLRDIIAKAGGSDDRRDAARAVSVQLPKQEADGNTITVEGRSELVHKVIAQIRDMVGERESQVTETMDVPVEKHRLLIGRRGETKRSLEAQFKVAIDIPRQGSAQTGITIVGQAPDVAKAKAHLQDLVKDQHVETIQVPRAMHHAITNQGQLFRKLRGEHGVMVDHAGQAVPPKPAATSQDRTKGGPLPLITDEPEDGHAWRVVTRSSASSEEGDIPWVLQGAPEAVAKAKKAVETALEQAMKQTTTGYLVLSDPRTYRRVIGPGGSTVNAIRNATGCKITVPRDQARDEAIEVVGTHEGVEQAKDLILQAVYEDAAHGADGGRSRRRDRDVY